MNKAWPTAQLIHLPVHASWLNQCEIYFSIVQRKIVTPNDFTDTDQIRAPPGRVRGPLQPPRRSLRLEVHSPRPPRPPPAHRATPAATGRSPARRLNTPEELTAVT